MELDVIFRVFIGSISVTFLAWLIVHFNGKTLLGIVDLVIPRILNRNKSSAIGYKSWLSIATEAEVIILGLSPIAIASLICTSRGNCFNSIQGLLVTEVIVFGLFLFIPHYLKRTKNFFGEQFYRSHWLVFVLGIVWCLGFSVWGYLAINPTVNQGIDRLLVNGNGDMWFYLRRFAGYRISNLSFDNQPACFYLQTSPKKLSSFIGSIIVYISPSTVYGITLFQGLLGCSLFLSLFGNWVNFNYQGKSLSKVGTIWGVVWAITSPSVFWLIISSYLSNALFVSIFILSLTAVRRICLNSHRYNGYTEAILLFCFILNVFSFYMVLLPVALVFYLSTLFIYHYERYLRPFPAVKHFSKIMLFTGISILICCTLFPQQINLTEVTGNLNALKEHGKNIVPLNPWSLIQEKPNPMPNIKDFGVWFNVVVGTIFSGFVLRIILRNLLELKQTKKTPSIYFKDLIAAALVVIIYLLYLFAYIPLDYTYRLGKFAISILYPLAIVATLPTTFWLRDRLYANKSRRIKLLYSALIVLHIILHIDKTLYLGAQPIGKYEILATDNIKAIDSATIIRCLNVSSSQQYEKILGLELAKKYPKIAFDVITDQGLMDNLFTSDITLKGKEVMGEKKNLCIYSIEF